MSGLNAGPWFGLATVIVLAVVFFIYFCLESRYEKNERRRRS